MLKLVVWNVIHILLMGVFGVFAYHFGTQDDYIPSVISLAASLGCASVVVYGLKEMNDIVNKQMEE